MDILDDMGVSKLSATFFFKVNYSFKGSCRVHTTVGAPWQPKEDQQHIRCTVFKLTIYSY